MKLIHQQYLALEEKTKPKQLNYSTVHIVAVCLIYLLVPLVVSYKSKSDGANDKLAGKVQRLSGNYSINVLTTSDK